MITHEDRRRNVPRKEAMLARRIRQRSRKAGFTPVCNNRISKRVEATTALLTVAYEKSGAAVPSAAQIELEAWTAVARTLPTTPIGVRVRAYA